MKKLNNNITLLLSLLSTSLVLRNNLKNNPFLQIKKTTTFFVRFTLGINKYKILKLYKYHPNI